MQPAGALREIRPAPFSCRRACLDSTPVTAPAFVRHLSLPRNYGPRSLRTLRSLIDVLSPPPDLFDVPSKDRVLETVLGFVPFLPGPLRFGLPIGLWLFESAPPLFGFGLRRFSSLSQENAARYLRRWEEGRPPLVQIYAAFHSIVLCSFYQQPEVLAALEVGWEARAVELIRRRAQLLRRTDEAAAARDAGERRQAAT